MTLKALFHRLRSNVVALTRAREGQVAVTFTLALIPIIGFVGAAVDYSRANSDRTAMQAAVDSTALMMSKNVASLTPTQINAEATNYFNAIFTRSKDVSNVTVTTTYTTSGGPQVVVNATGTVATTFLKPIGIQSMMLNVSSTVKWGNMRLRVALVLDNTGSMAQYSKLSTLKTALNDPSTGLLKQLQNAATQNGDVYVSIVPFVKDVNVDPVNYNATWIDWGSPTTGWEGEPPNPKPSNWYRKKSGSSCPFSSSSQGFQCTDRPATASGAATTSNIPSTGNYAGLICPSMDNGNINALRGYAYYNGCYNTWTQCVGSACVCTNSNTSQCSCTGSGASKTCTAHNVSGTQYYDHTWRPTNTNATYTPALVLDSNNVPYATPAHSTWNGCVADRGDSTAPNSGNYDTNVSAPVAGTTPTLYPAEQYESCQALNLQAVKPLSYDWSGMNTLVNNMVADGNTNQAIGLQLGWQSLVGGGPFPAPPVMDPNYQYQQVIILLTDGLNTQDRWYSNASQIDARQQMTCDNIHAAKITLYTVQVNTDGDPTSTLLQHCAGSWSADGSTGVYPDPNKFFLLTSANAIITTFQQIATSLSDLRVAK
jgi:Flp pilus assembly protein TadG